jgi:spore maturation protein SpmB
LRAAAGSKDPAGVVFTTWFASGIATVVAILAATLLAKLPRYRVVAPSGPREPDAPSEPMPAAPIETETTPPRFGGWLAAGYVVALAAALVWYVAREGEARPLPDVLRSVLSYWMIPVLIAGLVLFGWARGVKVYESLVAGAKDGFQVALRIMPYLIAILVAVAMFRASGCLGLFVSALSPFTSPLGLPAEAVPMAILRPLSGSGSFGVMSEILTARGPDSPLGYLVSTMQGSTDTTFYILAVYFGAVGIRKTRHAVPAGLLADAAGIMAAVFICRAVWGLPVP